jgi:glycerate kinase
VHVLLAPDSFKGSATATEVVDCLRAGWLEVRPTDVVTGLPLADGGEGTLDAIARAAGGSSREGVEVATPAGRGMVPWLLLPDGTAVVELAAACGLPLWPRLDPLGAHTYALGQVLAAASRDVRVKRIVVALGGSASTDGGVGALVALGAQLSAADGGVIGFGGAALTNLERIDLSAMVAPPVGGVEVLVDVDAPLLGPGGAAAAFGPQKGASRPQVQRLEAALTRLSVVLGGDPLMPGAGAAGGTAFGLVNGWGGRLRSGSSTVADLVGLGAAIREVDLVITGEGRLDEHSVRGKVVGQVVATARLAGVDVWACVGDADGRRPPGLSGVIRLCDLAGSVPSALAEPRTWLREAGRRMARNAATT